MNAPPYWPSPFEHLKGGMQLLPSSFVLYGRTIGVGDYGIDFSATNSGWVESLSITEDEASFIERITVTRDEEVIFDREWRVKK